MAAMASRSFAAVFSLCRKGSAPQGFSTMGIGAGRGRGTCATQQSLDIYCAVQHITGFPIAPEDHMTEQFKIGEEFQKVSKGELRSGCPCLWRGEQRLPGYYC
jgi:hypothetical protein